MSLISRQTQFLPQGNIAAVNHSTSSASSFYQLTVDIFSEMNKRFWENSAVKWFQKYEPFQFISKSQEIGVAGTRFLIPLLACRRDRCGTNEDGFIQMVQKTSVVSVLYRIMKVASIISVPYSIFYLVTHAIDFIKGSLSQKIDAGFLFMEDLSWLLDGIVAFARGIYELGGIPIEALAWVTPIGIISTVLWSMKAFFEIKDWVESDKFLKSMDAIQIEEADEIRSVKVLTWLESKDVSELQKHFNEDGKVLKNTINKIKRQALHHPDLGDLAIETLRHRCHSKILGNALKMTATIIGLIGFATLFFTPINPIGYGLLLASGALSLGNLIRDKINLKDFEHKFFLPQEKKP